MGNEVHFSVKHPGETVISGMRQSCQVAVYVDLPRAASDGLRFYRSANDVILCAGIDGVIPPTYIESVWNIKKREKVFPPSSTEPGASSAAAPSADSIVKST